MKTNFQVKMSAIWVAALRAVIARLRVFTLNIEYQWMRLTAMYIPAWGQANRLEIELALAGMVLQR